MPFKNEHAARQFDPDPRVYKRYRRTTDLHGIPLPTGISVIYGIRRTKGPRGGVVEIQSVRFNKFKYSPLQAKTWLKKHKLSSANFEKAIPEKKKSTKKLTRRRRSRP